MTISKGYSNVFEALEDNPAMAQNLKIRSEQMISLRKYIWMKGWARRKPLKYSVSSAENQ